VHGVAVAARAGVDADVAPLLRQKRSITRLLRSMNSCSMSLPVHGLRESFLLARRPSVKSIETRTAPASKHWRMSFSTSSHRSLRNSSRE